MGVVKPNDDKRSIGAPCAYKEFDKRKNRLDVNYPSVNCNHICAGCGWNPKEKERRLQTGKFCTKLYRRNSETGELVELPDKTKSLYFEKLVPDVIG